MEISNIHLVAGLGFIIAFICGAIVNKTNFCTMGAVSDWVNMGLKGRFGSWMLAMGVAVAGVQLLDLTGLIDLTESIYRTTVLGLGGFIIGGLMFGIGMTLAGGCGQRTLVRVGGGNLKSLIVFIVLGLSAYMTLRGIIGVARLELIEPLSIDLGEQGIEDQGLASTLLHWLNVNVSVAMRWIFAVVVALLLIGLAFSIKELRNSFDNLLAGFVVGGSVVAAWVITGIIGYDDFDPVPLEGLSFVAPIGNSISYLMTYTGATITFAIAVVFGLIVGSFVYALVSRTFRIETFSERGDMLNHLIGGVLMGVGGVLSLGCTIGQGVTGISTLALGSFIATAFIILGSAITMRVQYHRMDDRGRFSSLLAGIADIIIPWRKLA